ncbi:hypothetical protein Bca52824_027417 [Brassica carinata]|uniref:Uncharacterized protein n=1 Tax=Brassica carinata TaxID=52824 RepID=A0A8X7SII9_BRACI|nr:hypothetical protein Bca52824_027417 [Brassica carinata]
MGQGNSKQCALFLRVRGEDISSMDKQESWSKVLWVCTIQVSRCLQFFNGMMREKLLDGRRALIEARNENRKKDKTIEELKKTIAELRKAKIYQAWTNKNPGRRFYGSVLYKCRGACNFFQWYDEGEAFGWQKRALIEARNENRKKDKTIEELKKTIAELRSELVKNEELEEDIINSFLKL